MLAPYHRLPMGALSVKGGIPPLSLELLNLSAACGD